MKQNRKEYIVADKPTDCSECMQRSTCKTPCDRVERWVSQDYVGANSNVVMQNGIGIVDGHYNDWIDMMAKRESAAISEDDLEADWSKWEQVQEMRLSEKITRFIFSYYVMGRRIRDIAIMEGSSSQAIDQRHIQARRAIAKKLRMSDNWMSIRDDLKYRSILDYDVARMHFNISYPRKAISSVVGIHLSNVGKRISKYLEKSNERLQADRGRLPS